MATFQKGQSMKAQRVYIASAFPVQKEGAKEGDKPTHYDISLGIANDLVDPKKDKVIADPMLGYNPYEKDGEKKISNTIRYAASQYDKMMDVANTKGKFPVFEADLFPTRPGAAKRGLVVNTGTLKKVDQAFDHEKHKENTDIVRADKKAQREAKAAEAAAAKEAEAKEKEAAATKEKEAAPLTEAEKRSERAKRAAATRKANKEAAKAQEPDLEM